MTEDVSPWVQGGVGMVALAMLWRISSKLLAIIDRKLVGGTEVVALLREVAVSNRDMANSNKAIEITTKSVAATNRVIAESTKKQEELLTNVAEVTTDLVKRSLPPGPVV